MLNWICLLENCRNEKKILKTHPWSNAWQWCWFHDLLSAVASITDRVKRFRLWRWRMFFADWFDQRFLEAWQLDWVRTRSSKSFFAAAHIDSLVLAFTSEVEGRNLMKKSCRTFGSFNLNPEITWWIAQMATARIKRLLIFMINCTCCTWLCWNDCDVLFW